MYRIPNCTLEEALSFWSAFCREKSEEFNIEGNLNCFFSLFFIYFFTLFLKINTFAGLAYLAKGGNNCFGVDYALHRLYKVVGLRKTQVHRYFAGSIMNDKFLSDIVSNVSMPFALITKYSNLLMALTNREQLIFNSAVALINERQRGDELLYNDALKCKHIYFMTRGHPKHGQGFRILSKKEILESMFDAFSGRVGAVMIKWSLLKLIHPEFACKLADDSIDAQMLLDLVQLAVNEKIDIWQIIGVLSYVNFSGARVIMFLYDDVTVLNAISATTQKHKKWQGINIMLAAARDIELDILDTFIPDRIVHVYTREDPELLPDVQKFMEQCVTLKCGRKFDPTHLSDPMIHISHLPGGELCKKKSTTFDGYLKIPIEQWDWEYYTSCKEYITQQRYAKNALHLFAKSSVPLASVGAAAQTASRVLPSAPPRSLVLTGPLLPPAAPTAPPSVPVASMVVAAPTVPMVLSAAPLALAAPLMISVPSAPSMSAAPSINAAAVPPCAPTMPRSHSRSSPLLQPPSLASMVPSLSVSTPSILLLYVESKTENNVANVIEIARSFSIDLFVYGASGAAFFTGVIVSFAAS